MRLPRSLTRRPRPAAILAAGLATAFLGAAAALGPSASPTSATPRPTAGVTVTAPGDDNRDGIVDEDESGWDCRTMGNRVCGTDKPVALPVDCTPSGVCTVDGLPDECANAGDDTALCVTVASRPAYAWTNPDGSKATNPDGRAQLRDLEEAPGTPEFTAALEALDAEYREIHPHG
ncbi:hypothetical protein [Streptomyces sp. NBC_00620]|uniref:hypothetical protein n=1 Tax=Streptomyces sp. NBC_00620 TaxID=2903666 RepID=UPI00225AA9FA|nr:hypothetical protein [Streptomyces sp. NBC_00620]MCX4976511.1 hypothetical protein [Streptomyces sp. NBC_00620]